MVNIIIYIYIYYIFKGLLKFLELKNPLIVTCYLLLVTFEINN